MYFRLSAVAPHSLTGVGRFRSGLQLSALTSILLLTGCMSLSPEPLDKNALKDQAKQDAITARQDVAPITGPLTLEEAIACVPPDM